MNNIYILQRKNLDYDGCTVNDTVNLNDICIGSAGEFGTGVLPIYDCFDVYTVYEVLHSILSENGTCIFKSHDNLNCESVDIKLDIFRVNITEEEIVKCILAKIKNGDLHVYWGPCNLTDDEWIEGLSKTIKGISF